MTEADISARPDSAQRDADFSAASNFRVCIDFGTAASKAALGCEDSQGVSQVRPLAIGAIAGAATPFLVPSAMFITEDTVFLGAAALAQAAKLDDPQREELLSFKSILAARDIAEALDVRLRPSLDPTGSFAYRDALIIYLAFLLALVGDEIARQTDLPPTVLADARRRYTHPVFRPGADHAKHFGALFNEAEAVSREIGPTLTARRGAPIAAVRAALAQARTRPGDGRLDGALYEAHAAALTHVTRWSGAIRRLIVFDVGAGTTDIAGFDIDGALSAPNLKEVEGARRTIALACDEIDTILLDIFLRKWGASKTRSSQQRLWRSMTRSVRSMKEDVFATGKATLQHEGKTITVRINDLKGDTRFKAFRAALADAYLQSLTPMTALRREADVSAIHVVLAGGGSRLAFVREIVRDAKVAGAKNIEIQVEPSVPSWIRETPALAPIHDIFPQLAIAMGGALARL